MLLLATLSSARRARSLQAGLHVRRHARRFAVESLFAALSLMGAAEEAAGETIRGRVTDMRRGPCSPKGNCEWISFAVRAEDGSAVTARLEKMVVEGTVFVGHRVEVDGSRDRNGVFKVDRITDLETLQTTGYDSPNPLYADGHPLRVTGTITAIQDIEPHGKGERFKKTERQRFVLSVKGANRNFLVSVELAAFRLNSFLKQGQTVIADGEWTRRNVLRAKTVKDTTTGAISR